jgi:predicted RNase H-like HicB family nuclease
MESETVTYLIIPEQSHDGSWWAIAPDLPGLVMYGETREELIANAPEAMDVYFEAQRESGGEIAAPGTYPVELIYDQEEPVPVTVTVPAA